MSLYCSLFTNLTMSSFNDLKNNISNDNSSNSAQIPESSESLSSSSLSLSSDLNVEDDDMLPDMLPAPQLLRTQGYYNAESSRPITYDSPAFFASPENLNTGFKPLSLA